MKRVLASIMLCGALATTAPAQEFVEGQHYFPIEPANAAPADGVEVIEAFSYLCNHCKTFEPYVENWLERLPEGVTFKRLPVEFGRSTWGLYARAYVTAEVLGIAEESHPAMMDAIWKQQRQMRNMDQLAEFYSQFGVDKQRFLATAKSFAVDMRMRREQQLVREFNVSGTPSMIVNGKYRVAAGGAVSDFDQMLAIVDYLVAREMGDQAEAQATDTAAVTAD